MHIYAHPLIKYPYLQPGQVVEHKDRPGVPLVVRSGPHDSLTTRAKYFVETPEGRVEPVKRENLKI